MKYDKKIAVKGGCENLMTGGAIFFPCKQQDECIERTFPAMKF